ncbi:MAG: S1 RNA-binding domain-containing protein, partial [Gammaproteobacteria bacterium]|nr:S1 RNA-binding domain-containing protein [Gammaproteobacteria bacterium]
ALADKFVQNPRDIVKAGDIVTTKVLEVDVKRKRIALTLRLQDEVRVHPIANGTTAPTRTASGLDKISKEFQRFPVVKKQTEIKNSLGTLLEAAFKKKES